MPEKKPDVPKWLTPERQSILTQLWQLYGNQCLLGHKVCNIPEHYIYVEHIPLKTWDVKEEPCVDQSGNPIRDEEGNKLCYYTYPIRIIGGKQPERSQFPNTPKGQQDYENALQDYQYQTRYTPQRLFDLKQSIAQEGFREEDRAQRSSEFEAEQKRLHPGDDPTFKTPILRWSRSGGLRGGHDYSREDIFKPAFTLKGLGVDTLTLRPFAHIKMTHIPKLELKVDLGQTLFKSKNEKRKFERYQILPNTTRQRINNICELAIKALS